MCRILQERKHNRKCLGALSRHSASLRENWEKNKEEVKGSKDIPGRRVTRGVTQGYAGRTSTP